MGPWHTNRQYMAVNNQYHRFSYWEPIKEIIKLLINYKNKYHIIIRTSGNKAQKNSVKNILKKSNSLSSFEISDSSCGEPFKDIVMKTDIFINTWCSTTFWEECLTNADIFLFESGDLTDRAKENISGRAFLYDNMEEFLEGLSGYLDKEK